MKTAKKNAKPIAIAAGVAAGILGLYLLYKRTSKSNSRTLKSKEKDAMISKIKVTYNGRVLGVDTVVEIHEVIIILTCPEMLPINLEFQKERRKHRGNLAKYVEICEEYLYQEDTIFSKIMEEVLGHLRIPQDLLLQSVFHYQSQNNKKIADLLLRIKEAEPNAKEAKAISLDTFKAFLKRYTELNEGEFSRLSSTMSMLKEPPLIVGIISYKVNDVIYDEFGLADEDISAALKTHLQKLQTADPELFKRYTKISQALEAVELGRAF